MLTDILPDFQPDIVTDVLTNILTMILINMLVDILMDMLTNIQTILPTLPILPIFPWSTDFRVHGTVIPYRHTTIPTYQNTENQANSSIRPKPKAQGSKPKT